MSKLSRDLILAAAIAIPPVETMQAVEVPELGGEVTLRPMTGARRDRFEQAASKDPGNNIRARLAAYSVCDEFGKFLFDENDIRALGELPASALDRIFTVALKINAIGTADVDALEKN